VYAKAPFGGPEQTLSDLGRYTHRVAISNPRLLDVPEDQIRFTWRNRQQGDRSEVAPLDAHTFIQRFLSHILPSGFVRIRPVAGEPLPSLYLALMPPGVGTSGPATSARAKERGPVDAAVDRDRHHALAGVGSPAS